MNNDKFIADIEASSYDSFEFILENELELSELFETGSAEFVVNGNKYVVSISARLEDK